MKVDFGKYADGLVPAIVQDNQTQKVLMLGFMNEEALKKQNPPVRLHFTAGQKKIWTKGEESGNFLELKIWLSDCDNDTLLIKAHPLGPTCHTGADTCWSERNHSEDFLFYLEDIIDLRKQASPAQSLCG